MTRTPNPFAKARPRELLLGVLAATFGIATVITATQECGPATESPRLTVLARTRLVQLETSGVLSHEGFDALPWLGAAWRGEVVLSSSNAVSYCDSMLLWEASPPHKEVLDHTTTEFGYASSDAPHGGLYYAVLITEEHDGEPAIDIGCEVGG